MICVKWQIAWLECTVKSRIETGDHWVLYATVDNGKLEVHHLFILFTFVIILFTFVIFLM